MSPSLWAQYVQELRGADAPEFIEYDWGFISYSFPKERPETLFCEDCFIVPEARDGARALRLVSEAERKGLKSGRTETMFVVRTDAASAAQNLRIYLSMGFAPVLAQNGSIFLTRKIKAGK